VVNPNFWINNFVGLVIGILGSIIVWWIFSHILVPKIRFENFISKVKTNETKSGIKYRLAFRNNGRRAIIDVEIIVRLSIPLINSAFPDNLSIFSIPLGYSRLPKMESKKSCRRHITRLDVHQIEELINPHIANTISHSFETIPDISKDLKIRGIDAKDFEGNPNLLEHLMRLGNGATLQVFIFGYDEFSGARKLFGPKVYKVTEIKHRRFPKLSC